MGGWTYILTNKPHGVLYIGVISDIAARIWQHRGGMGSAFCRKYGLDRVVLVEPHAHCHGDSTRKGAQGVEVRMEGSADRNG